MVLGIEETLRTFIEACNVFTVGKNKGYTHVKSMHFVSFRLLFKDT